jgi:DNA-binding XRE family transcriptional regulator
MASEMFAGRLRELRAVAGLSQKALADSAGIALSAIGHLEAGRRLPAWETVLALCAALGVSCEAFTVAAAPAPAPARGRPRKPDAESDSKPAKGKRPKRA